MLNSYIVNKSLNKLTGNIKCVEFNPLNLFISYSNKTKDEHDNSKEP